MSQLNNALFTMLLGRPLRDIDPNSPEYKSRLLIQQAVDAINEFTRAKMSEDGRHRRFVPPQVINDNEVPPCG